MPRGIKAKGSESALLQMKRAHRNKLKEATAHRTRARVVESYMQASRRNEFGGGSTHFEYLYTANAT